METVFIYDYHGYVAMSKYTFILSLKHLDILIEIALDVMNGTQLPRLDNLEN
jgi:hypothetical protein